ncbi:hypothetical protein [Patulibacter minatonensis]|uniref:hypothetical protein n=1 Tax=Patulibacter minatonensis TaxID=298163 RepID=UPI0004BAB38D|nr:hypothetical protein [Patulibacter minatonensis]
MTDPGAPTRLDRTLLAVVSGPVGHLVGTALEVGAALAPVVAARVRARFARRGA